MSMFEDLKPFTFDDPMPVMVPCTIGGRKYTLHEADEPAANRYMSILSRGVVEGDGGVNPLDNLAAADQYLLSQCLRDDATNELVPQDVITGWTKRCKKPLVALLKRISDLEIGQKATAENLEKQIAALQLQLDAIRKAAAEEPAKNAPGAGADGSA